MQAITTYIPVIGNFLRPLFFQTIVSASNRMTDFTGIDHGRLDKGGIAAIPGDPFACITFCGRFDGIIKTIEDAITSIYLLYN